MYEPMLYIMGLGGKRLRPVLTLMAADALNGNYREALPAALALELFHNFSLVHDDIMDAAPLRRGEKTVHEKWDINTAILSGDAMLIRSYQLFEAYEPVLFKSLVQLFSETALHVCEGQQYDVDYENREGVSIKDYLQMIKYKTAVLLGACLKSGALIAGAKPDALKAAYEFGIDLGIAFQLQDDYLDAFGDPKTFGKQPGGDIIANKKTYLYIKSAELANSQGKKELEHLFSIQPQDPASKIQAVTEIYRKSGGADATRDAISYYTDKAFGHLDKLPLEKDARVRLKSFGEQLKSRED